MYWSASNDGRGAALTIYDEDRIIYGYPKTNTPPYLPDRFMVAVADNSATADLPVALGVNRVDVGGFDLQGSALTTTLVSSLHPAQWSLSGTQLAFTPPVATAARLADADIANGASYDWAYVQASDGVNLSRPARCAVIQIYTDSKPDDGLPTTWLNAYFGSSSVAPVGAPSHPLSDPDSDGLTNRQEFNLGTNPIDPGSPANWLSYDYAQRKLSFTPLRFAALKIQSTTDFVNWTDLGLYGGSAVPQTIPISVSGDPVVETRFYRAVPVP
jgi:hypothetical protein